ncbi:MAG: hypothetical protein LQ349_008727 [Xanthoria aureola]|nr:MAG: hypothetical protein LQ349_008727 [Xanthoria aureola]
MAGSEREQSNSDDGGNPFYPEVVDVESVSTDLSEHRKTFADRLRYLVRRLRKTGEDDDDDFTDDYEVEQIVKSLDHYIVGYPKIAALANADPSFLIYRKFGWLHNRLLLYLQDELVALEYKLNKLDRNTFANDNDVKLKSRREDYNNPGLRRDTVKQIAEKLKEYGQLIHLHPSLSISILHTAQAIPILTLDTDEHLLRFQKIQAIKRPTLRNQTSFYNFMTQTRSIVSSESNWIREGVDLAALAHEEEPGRFGAFLIDLFHKISTRATQAIFRTREQETITGHERAFLVSSHRLDVFLRLVLTVLAAILLLLPVVVLFELQPTDPARVRHNAGLQILTVFVFTLVFSAACSVCTKASRQQVFAAMAAYCAVLVVFLSNTLNAYPGGWN